jgi:hypothetical protein
MVELYLVKYEEPDLLQFFDSKQREVLVESRRENRDRVNNCWIEIKTLTSC